MLQDVIAGITNGETELTFTACTADQHFYQLRLR